VVLDKIFKYNDQILFSGVVFAIDIDGTDCYSDAIGFIFVTSLISSYFVFSKLPLSLNIFPLNLSKFPFYVERYVNWQNVERLQFIVTEALFHLSEQLIF
jgi:hypothetical protein